MAPRKVRMLVYSTVIDANTDMSVIQYLRQNKYLWDYKIYFDKLLKRQADSLALSTLKKNKKTIYVCLQGTSHSLKYWRPYKSVECIPAHMDAPSGLFYNQFFDYELVRREKRAKPKSKICSESIEKICYISSYYSGFKKTHSLERQLYSELGIFDAYHAPIIMETLPDLMGFRVHRVNQAELKGAKYMATLCAENNKEKDPFQEAALQALEAGTPAVLKARHTWKNFIRQEFVIVLEDYKQMIKKQKNKAIQAVQELLSLGTAWLTPLIEYYISFFKEAFSSDIDPDFPSIIKESKIFRKQFIAT